MADPAIYSNPLSPENVIYRPNIQPDIRQASVVGNTANHPIRASKSVSSEALRQYLEAKHSPLVDSAGIIAQSAFSSTIIGICAIEEYGCTVNPFGSNNLWGIMCGSGVLCRYADLPTGIDAINRFLERAEARGRTTIESFRGWYCASACTTWEPTVIKVKLLVENL